MAPQHQKKGALRYDDGKPQLGTTTPATHKTREGQMYA